IDPTGQSLFDSIQTSAEIAFANASLYSQTVAERDAQMQELEMMRQIDRELSDTIQLERVFDLTLDWALRYTLAQGASLSLYSSETDELRLVAALGYSADDETAAALRVAQGGIRLRVARLGRAELIPNVSFDPDYVRISSAIQSHMSVPVRREDQVIAVITVENRRLNAFTQEHLSFVDKLAARAGVAIDNARLYSESVREREKLSHILSEIADIVFVVGTDERMILINQSGIAALRLSTDTPYTGRHFAEALANTPLLPLFRRATTTGQMMVEEVLLDGNRTYYAEFSPQAEIGWIIVMHDITPLKQTDELKRELVATVSHDLKQPLSVMNGYLQLLEMSQRLDERGDGFLRMIARAIDHMRHLIDDVLDLAKIESGVALELQPVMVDTLIGQCIESVKPLADSKSMELVLDLSAGLPLLAGDPNRLQQIFSNLVGNAVKYTQPEGKVRVSVEKLDQSLRFTVKDNGMGISPEDQAHIFDRFYRVRRPETETIEGTGLGLAIVKKLIEAHKGQIGLESSLGEGTTFYVTLPIFAE
ncbi:MAG: ATP-binding protein, partial [Chloroflexota bacterium]